MQVYIQCQSEVSYEPTNNGFIAKYSTKNESKISIWINGSVYFCRHFRPYKTEAPVPYSRYQVTVTKDKVVIAENPVGHGEIFVTEIDIVTSLKQRITNVETIVID